MKQKEPQDTILLKTALAFLSVVFFAGLIYYANRDILNTQDERARHETVTVVQIKREAVQQTEAGFYTGVMDVVVEIESGSFAGAQVEGTHFINQMSDARVAVGDQLSARVAVGENDTISIQIQNVERMPGVIALIVIFIASLALMGGKKGLMTIASLGFTLISLIFILIPLMLAGYPVVWLTFLVLGIVTIVTLFLLGGFSIKTGSAIIGCLIGIFIAFVATLNSGRLLHISGFHMEEVSLILSTTDFPAAEAGWLFMSGVLIAALGAVLDTAMTIASTVDELKNANPKMGAFRLFAGGMRVGRDTMGTMSSTLILAFTGSSLNLLILIYGQGISLNQLLNSPFIVMEIIRSVAGSLGIIATIPAVAMVSAFWYGRRG